ncbi:SafA/ExsA family spore coat assembly protein [Virgibacillus necropolis]|uniref:LysM domain-containing protein n=1 Tax=Virgibacillus necropolis TaxID=163877 RepID=A0A221MBU8_9BACI|nr:SafA/ExsA family spore coat assembly protein [Virgibacillus necropolis]ASN05113.1 hypothetical protein CFK40_08855 [Virgibacillus necropolis]
MKIHIVKKGDTLWEIANQYDVDFEQLKELNTQLSSPDMIMPGMKIKVPSNSKPVKKENMYVKEKEMVKTPYKDISPKPLPVIKEDEKEKPKMMHKPPMMENPKMTYNQPMMENPKMPHNQPMMQKPPVYHMPIMDQDMHQYTTINFSQMPTPKEEVKQVKHHENMHPMPHHMPHHMQMVPMCCYPMYPMHQGNVSPMHMPPQKPMPHKQHGCGCGCEGKKPPFHHYPSNMNMYEEKSPYQHYDKKMNKSMYDEMPEMEMPKKPNHKFDDDCNDMEYKHHYKGYNQPFPKMDENKGYGNPYPAPPGFQPFPNASFRDDEDENNNE